MKKLERRLRTCVAAGRAGRQRFEPLPKSLPEFAPSLSISPQLKPMVHLIRKERLTALKNNTLIVPVAQSRMEH